MDTKSKSTAGKQVIGFLCFVMSFSIFFSVGLLLLEQPVYGSNSINFVLSEAFDGDVQSTQRYQSAVASRFQTLMVDAGADGSFENLSFSSINEDQANVIYRPIHELPDIRWKDLGEHLSQTITNLSKDEEVLYAEILDDFETGTYLAATKLGQIKRFERKEFTPWRTYKSKSVKYAKLKDDSDFIVTVTPIQLDDIMIITQKGYALRFNADEVPVVGAKAAGVKAINLKDDDTVQAVFVANTQSFYLLTQRASLKRVATADIPQAKRAGRGLQVLRELKTKPHRVFTAGPVFTENAGGEIDLLATPVEETPQTLLVTATTGETAEVDLSLLNLSDRTSNGSFIEGLADKEVFSAKIIER